MVLITRLGLSLASRFLHQILAQLFKEVRQMRMELIQLDFCFLQCLEDLLDEYCQLRILHRPIEMSSIGQVR